MSTTKPRLTSDAPILAEAEDGGIDWGRVFRIYLRALAVLTLVRGLGHWAVICGGPNADGIAFEDLAPALQAATVFFAVIELVAGVGLWLAAAWGGAVWILASVVALAIDAAVLMGVEGWVQSAARPPAASIGDLVLIAFYALATAFAARQADEGRD